MKLKRIHYSACPGQTSRSRYCRDCGGRLSRKIRHYRRTSTTCERRMTSLSGSVRSGYQLRSAEATNRIFAMHFEAAAIQSAGYYGSHRCFLPVIKKRFLPYSLLSAAASLHAACVMCPTPCDGQPTLVLLVAATAPAKAAVGPATMTSARRREVALIIQYHACLWNRYLN